MKQAAQTKSETALYQIRSATQQDVPLIVQFIRELAEYEKLLHEMVADEATITETMFGPKPYAECLIAEVDGEPAGFALFFHTYSTFLGKPGMYLEDLFVRPAFRSRGIGLGFFKAMAKIALERDCGRIEWGVLDWNESAIKFYEKKLGSVPLSDWIKERLDRAAIEKLAE